MNIQICTWAFTSASTEAFLIASDKPSDYNLLSLHFFNKEVCLTHVFGDFC